MTKYYQEREDELFARQKEIIDRIGIRNPLIFDVGANMGQSIAKYRKTFPECRIHAFEPNPDCFEHIDKAWGRDCHIRLARLALSDQTGKFKFYRTKVPEAASLLKPTDRLLRLSMEHKYDYRSVEVQCDTLDAYCKRLGVKHIDIAKIDVQGAEALVLKGAEESLATRMITVFYIEITLAESYEGQSKFIDILAPLETHGYRLWDIMPFLYTTPGRLWAANALFISSEAASIIENFK